MTTQAPSPLLEPSPVPDDPRDRRETAARKGVFASLQSLDVTDEQIAETFGRPAELVATNRLTALVRQIIAERRTAAPGTIPAGRPTPEPIEEPPAIAPSAPETPEQPEAVPASPADLRDAVRAVQGFVDRSPEEDWDADQRDDRPLTVWEAVAEITRSVDPIAKDRTATQGASYKYRGIDDVFAAVHPLLGEVGLLIFPGEVVESRFETRATGSGGTLNVARLRVRYTVVGPDGSWLPGEAWGEGGDSGDKATQKAHSQSYKSFVLQLFSIPTEDSSRDEPDATNPPARPFTAEEIQRATTAARAGEDAGTVEDLAGVRRRALHLLDVPVPLEDGGIMPLGLLFDARRARLEGDAR